MAENAVVSAVSMVASCLLRLAMTATEAVTT
jgi:hypothetical protein